jgi:hypothetical protein
MMKLTKSRNLTEVEDFINRFKDIPYSITAVNGVLISVESDNVKVINFARGKGLL